MDILERAGANPAKQANHKVARAPAGAQGDWTFQRASVTGQSRLLASFNDAQNKEETGKFLRSYANKLRAMAGARSQWRGRKDRAGLW
ncbi:MAG: hypothetical protein HYR55_04350 [Acidobacteria bacterium]|nr:hypothetical protein [Acidobacteriota bacterium]